MMTDKTLYHGSGVSIDKFDYAFTGIGNDQLGSGFYLTTSYNEAECYCYNQLDGKDKPGGNSNPTVHQIILHCKKPMRSNYEAAIPYGLAQSIILDSPVLDDQIEANWGEIAYEGREKLIKEAVESYAYNEPVRWLTVMHHLSNDFFPGYNREFFESVRKHTGYDALIHKLENDAEHHVAWFVEQIEIQARFPAIKPKALRP